MIAHPNGHDAETPPPGWQIVSLRGGPHSRQRFTIHTTDDKLELIDDDGRPQTYYRLNHRAELIHESLVGSAFGSKGGAA